jgi:hypothetical protein
LIVTELVVELHPVMVLVNVNVTLPAPTGVANPPFVTVATLVLLLVHVPPVPGANVIVFPIHKLVCGTVNTGNPLIVTELVVELQPVVVLVNVNVTLPAPTGVTNPPFVTVATLVLLLVHVPPVPGVKVIVLPRHNFVIGVLTLGFALMVTEEVVLLQPVVVFV